MHLRSILDIASRRESTEEQANPLVQAPKI